MESVKAARIALRFTILAIVAVALWLAWTEYQRYVAEFPEKFPWTELDLADPVGPFTARKLAALEDDPDRCLALVRAVGLAEDFAPSRDPGNPECGYADGIAVNDLGVPPRPAALVTSCPAAAALYLWQRDTLPAAAQTHLGTDIASFSHAGSYSCRRLYGRPDGPWSRHATADAVDVTGFTLVDGRTVSLIADWNGDADDAAFLRAARDGACDLFGSVLSPDYNAAHADHFHLAMRPGDWSACR
ncbi:extensin family protein [Sphingomicrobium sp. XHP0239]|uniref:extensin-like domain-containing protein n=1 Tax=Sphingomicrobium maritimum TaxID=3133972 RepID=UPI0031CC928E